MIYQTAVRPKLVNLSAGPSARSLSRAALFMLMVATLILLSVRLMRSSLASEPASAPARAEIADHYGKLPLSFEANEGQTAPEVKFISHGPGYDMYLTATGAVMTLRQPPAQAEKEPANRPPKSSVLRLKMIGAN